MISAVIPALNEEARIGHVIRYLKGHSLVQEVIVIDDGSTDNTVAESIEAGAKVFLSSMLGKGASMTDGLRRAQNEIILFLDGDIYNFSEDLIDKMTAPLFDFGTDFVKGTFKRKAGRVTQLTALPLLKTFFPELLRFHQPLGGIIAGRRSFLEKLQFENDYAVDVSLLIDIVQFGARIAEVDIGEIEHEHQDLASLSKMAFQVTRGILEKAHRYDRLNAEKLFKSVEEDRVSTNQFSSLIDRLDGANSVVLFDMDGTLIEGSFIEYLANSTGIRNSLKGLLGNHSLDAEYRTEMIARSLKGISKCHFEQVANSIPLKPFAKEAVIALRKLGHKVGIITDSYFIASEVIRKRVFADFSVAHALEFIDGAATGKVKVSPFMQFKSGCTTHSVCKSNFVRHINELFRNANIDISSVGNGLNDVCLFQMSRNSFAVYPENSSVAEASKHQLNNLSEISDFFSGVER